MNLLIKPSTIKGSVTIPPSKSLTHRYFIAASLACGISKIENPLFSDDTNHTLEALTNMGIKIKKSGNSVEIKGNNGQFDPSNDHIYLGDSGTSARLFIGLATLSNKAVIIDGSKRLQQRPNQELFQALENQGVKIDYLKEKYHLPARIHGKKLIGGKIKISGETSSQFISSLLMISPFAQNEIQIEITDELKSKPYIDLTIQAIENFGITVINNDYKSFVIKSGQQYKAQAIKVEGDYSSASYFIALSYLLSKPIKIKNLNPDSKQSDKIILDIIKNLNSNSNVTFDISNCPDIALTLGVVGPFCKSLTLKGVNRLVAKECDRRQALVDNLSALGAKLETGDNYIKIYKSKLKTGVIATYNDHRVAMSFSILGTIIPEGIVIKNAEVVNKSYPDFFEDLKQIGVNIAKI